MSVGLWDVGRVPGEQRRYLIPGLILGLGLHNSIFTVNLPLDSRNREWEWTRERSERIKD